MASPSTTERLDATYEPFNQNFQLDPYPALTRLRAGGPASPVQHPFFEKIVLVTRYDLVRQVHADPRWVKPGGNEGEVATFDSSPPAHTRLRSLAQKAFTVRRIEKLRAWAQELTAGLLDGLAGLGEVELVTQYADVMPIRVIQKMGGLAEEYAVELRHLMDAFLGTMDMEAQEATFARCEEYAAQVIAEKRANPGDDLTSDLIKARDGSDQLSEAELVQVLMTLLVNGAATTTNVIGTGVHNLLSNPDQLALLVARPELIGSAVEEMLRHECPVSGLAWTAKVDMDFEGLPFAAGDILGTSMQGANRDPAQFADPDRFDITRSPNSHLTFSHGIHRCLGAELARMELQVAVGTLVRRFPGLRAAGEVSWRGGPVVRGLTRLPVTLSTKV